MQIVTPALIKNKKVLLRYDMDVSLECKVQSLDWFDSAHHKFARDRSSKCKVKEDFKLRAGLDTLNLCIDNASKVIIVGHLGRPFKTAEEEKQGNPKQLSTKPIQQWLEKTLGQSVDFAQTLEQAAASDSKVVLLENIRFFHGEVPGAFYHSTCISKTCDIDFAHRLAALGEIYVNEAFSSYNIASSATIVPTILPHAAGLHFAEEVRVLRGVRENPKHPLVVIMGGAKVEDKLPVIEILAKRADAVLVGGKLVQDLNAGPANILVGKLNEAGTDIAPETTESWRKLIMGAKMIVWNGPLGKFEEPENDQSAEIAKMILASSAEIIVGGGDTLSLLGSLRILTEFEKKGFVSVGGGAILKFLADGTLPTIEELK